MKTAPFDDVMREVYGRDGQPTEKGRQMLADHEAARAERNKAIAGLIDERGRPTVAGQDRLESLAQVAREVLYFGHEDSCGAPCRIDLDGHDCCNVCNQAEDMLRATAAYYEESR